MFYLTMSDLEQTLKVTQSSD